MVSSTGRPTRIASASTIAVRTEPSSRASSPTSGAAVADPLAAALDHPELERQQLVECEPPERRVAALERIGIVGLLDRARDRDQPLRGGDVGGQVFRVGVAGLVERLADGRPQPERGQTGGQRIDRDDPARVEQLGVVRDDLELGVVEGQPATEMLDLAGHHDLRADGQPALDEAAAEPRRVDAAGVVLEPGDRALGAPPEAWLDPDVAHARLGRHDRAVLLPDEVAQAAHLAQVVVAPRQVEQEVADRVEVELDPGPSERRAGGQPGPGQRRREQLDRIGRDRDRTRRLGHAYSAAIRYR